MSKFGVVTIAWGEMHLPAEVAGGSRTTAKPGVVQMAPFLIR